MPQESELVWLAARTLDTRAGGGVSVKLSVFVAYV